MEARFMTFEEMLKEERVERHSSTKNLDADHFPVKNIGRIYTEDVMKIYFRSMIRSNLWRFHCSCEISRDN